MVEDEPDVRRFVCQTLRMQGYTVIEARHGIEALAKGETYQAPIDLLFSDVVMPQMNGGELATRLLAGRPSLKVLFISGYTGEALLRYGLVAGERADLLQKPFTASMLTSKIRTVLDARTRELTAGIH